MELRNEKKKRNNRYEIDMTSGNLFLKILIFSLPLAAMGVLQLLYNAADLIVVSNFSNDSEALGAVGSTSTLINLVVNLFMGLSVGTNVLAANVFKKPLGSESAASRWSKFSKLTYLWSLNTSRARVVFPDCRGPVIVTTGYIPASDRN